MSRRSPTCAATTRAGARERRSPPRVPGRGPALQDVRGADQGAPRVGARPGARRRPDRRRGRPLPAPLLAAPRGAAVAILGGGVRMTRRDFLRLALAATVAPAVGCGGGTGMSAGGGIARRRLGRT